MSLHLPAVSGIDGCIAAPPSKSFTHRALIAAACADGRSVISRPLHAEDAGVTVSALRQLGAEISLTDDGDYVVEGTGGAFHAPTGCTIDCHNSGTSMRLLLSLVLLADGPVCLTGSPRMQERPVAPLVDALNTVGGEVRYLKKAGYPPVCVDGVFRGGHLEIDASASSQFLSSALMAAPCGTEDTVITTPGEPASRTYLDITADVMAAFGVPVKRDGYRRFTVSPEGYSPADYTVEGDYSSASYFFAIAAVCTGTVEVTHLNPASCQGDRVFLRLLSEMGCRVTEGTNSVTVASDGDLKGIAVAMGDAPDVVLTLAAVAPFARGPTTITGVRNLKIKESNRLDAVVRIAALGGAETKLTDDTVTIIPGKLPGGGIIDPEDDHRTAMSAAVVALKRGDVGIMNPGCVHKSYPGFWDALREGGMI
ncbi:3-phosphoshikimate 1-carboxyvinyltransferase [Methanogenium organophilum]|uniref:3-phosphoshikimate 1-carboxyvinyltransferase n=1 Tax=Methanogenium organophilum TaxID=2199 RepID=A0A9X9T9B4_METOG|nr:3-phosphoshikimate 1-carboxyvinyltransferase [Methanogenium organophilum]WAI01932.1 3-phosphoshikimate 1-carboxyvinyltransferase [Methanogenium organophilum]